MIHSMTGRWTSRFGSSPLAAAQPATRAAALQVTVVAGCAAAIGVAAWVGDPAEYARTDPALANVLRCMALIKGGLAMVAVGMVLLRLRWAIALPAALGYVVGSALMAGSSMLIWELTCIPMAAIAFHAAALSLLWLGWRER